MTALNLSQHMSHVGIAGTGSYMPESVITNDQIASLIRRDGKDAQWAEGRLGIRERRFMTPLDLATGLPAEDADELDMAEKAARAALKDAGMEAEHVDLVWFVSCTQKGHQRHHFSTSAFELHKRLGLRPDARVLEMDAGCGGAVQAMANAADMLYGSMSKVALVVASNAPSRYYDNWEVYVAQKGRESYLSMYVFGDGAGAVVLKRYEFQDGPRIICSFLGADPTTELMVYDNPSGGVPVYHIHGHRVANLFGKYVGLALEGLAAKVPDLDFRSLNRYYFHQVNGLVLDKVVKELGLPCNKVPKHVERYGNIAAAATLVLLDEDRKSRQVVEGDLVAFCTVGAGVQYGALLALL